MDANQYRKLSVKEAVTHLNYDEAAYLAANPDIADAVKRGLFAVGKEHFDAIGHTENRLQLHLGSNLLPYTLLESHNLPSFSDLSEEYPDDKVPPLDRKDIDESRLSWDQLHWRRFGFLVLPKFLPEQLIDAYLAHRERSGVGLGRFENNVNAGTSPHILDIGCFKPLAEKIDELFGEELLFNFTLTKFTSTERDWHQDDYLGSPNVYGRYCAAWMAMDDVHPDSGPFEFVPGSHHWPGLRGALVKQYLTAEAREWMGRADEPGHWSTIAEVFTTPAIDVEIARRASPTQRFQARRGDVLIWHGKLVHRGTRAAVPGMRRPALIAHYYPVDQDPAQKIVRHNGGGIYSRNKS